MIALLLLLGVGCTPSLAFQFPKVAYRSAKVPSPKIDWIPCFNNPNVQCGVYDVPFDYANESAGRATLAVIRYVATASRPIGTIFVNPGGPGSSGVSFLASGEGERISNITSGFFDVVSWDPRGVNNSRPRIECFSSAAEETSFWQGTMAHNGIEARANFTSQDDLNVFYNKLNETDTILQQFYARCEKSSNNILKYIGTVATVRDMVSLADHLNGPSSLINFWGFSYGTVIGSYFVNMFPGRVGRVIFDGVVNPVIWSQQPAYKGWGDAIQSADEAFQGFSEACAQAGVQRCAISGGKNASSISEWVYLLIDATYFAHKLGYHRSSASIRSSIYSAMYAPRSWDDHANFLLKVAQEVAAILAAAPAPLPRSVGRSFRKFVEHLEGIPTFRKKVASQRWDALKPLVSGVTRSEHLPTAGRYGDLPQPMSIRRVYSFQAIACADSVDAPYVTMRDVFDELVRVTREVSPLFGPIWIDATLYCHRWTAKAVERFQGPFNSRLANPVLVIGNQADPVTPLVSASFLANALGGSAVLVEQDDYGHTTLAMKSNCTIDVISRYFIRGELPSYGKLCGTNQPPFGVIDEDLGVDKITTISPVYETTVNPASMPTQSSVGSAQGIIAPGVIVLPCFAIVVGACIGVF